MLYHLLIVIQEESFGLDSVGGGPFSSGIACAKKKNTDSDSKKNFSFCHFPLVAIS